MTPPAATAAPPAPAIRSRPVRHPRRVSGPARQPSRAFAPASPAPVLAPGARARVLELPQPGTLLSGALLDRLIRGRAWIGVLAFALIGIVTMQLLVLKLNNEIGRSLQRQVSLERQNAQLGIEGSEASAGDLVEPQAAAAGMTFVAPGALRFLTTGRASIQRAVATLSAPIQPAPEPTAAQPSESAAPASSEASSAQSNESAAPTSSEASPPATTPGG